MERGRGTQADVRRSGLPHIRRREPARGARQRRRVWAGLAGAVAFAPAGADPLAASAGAVEVGSLMALAVAGAALALVAGVVLALRWSRLQHTLAETLRAERARARCLEGVLDVWLWHSDAQHRVVQLAPPAGSADPSVAPQAALWECFQADDVPGWRSQLDSGRPLHDVPVRLALGSSPARAGLLRAGMVTDAVGAFAGYRGTWRERAEVGAGASPPAPATAPATGAPPSAPAQAGAPSDAESDHEAFSFTVSHDLRAPIRVVEGFTKIIKEDYGRALDRVGNDHLDRVLGAAARMNNMIDALLALSKLSSQPLASQPVNLSQLAGYVGDDLRRHWPERQVRLDIEPDMQVLGDPTLLRVVIENLLGNAWKYTAKVDAAHISFGRDPQVPLTFTVRDNGAGFDMRFADRLFGVFQRLHSANDFPGTGVGLASVRRIVRRHGGEIWGEGEVHHGARFHFSLPQGGNGRWSGAERR